MTRAPAPPAGDRPELVRRRRGLVRLTARVKASVASRPSRGRRPRGDGPPSSRRGNASAHTVRVLQRAQPSALGRRAARTRAPRKSQGRQRASRSPGDTMAKSGPVNRGTTAAKSESVNRGTTAAKAGGNRSQGRRQRAQRQMSASRWRKGRARKGGAHDRGGKSEAKSASADRSGKGGAKSHGAGDGGSSDHGAMARRPRRQERQRSPRANPRLRPAENRRRRFLALLPSGSTPRLPYKAEIRRGAAAGRASSADC